MAKTPSNGSNGSNGTSGTSALITGSKASRAGRAPPPPDPVPRRHDGGAFELGVSLHSYPGLTSHEIRGIAFAAACDTRTVVSYLHGLKQTDLMRFRIETALRASGFPHFIRARDGGAQQTATTNGQAGVHGTRGR
jgi:hypothetical protein